MLQFQGFVPELIYQSRNDYSKNGFKMKDCVTSGCSSFMFSVSSIHLPKGCSGSRSIKAGMIIQKAVFKMRLQAVDAPNFHWFHFQWFLAPKVSELIYQSRNGYSNSVF
jgi:hypothetical protein